MAFPCNQFGHQENGVGEEILKGLEYCRPGSGFVPKCKMMDKVDVNGESESPIFTYLKKKIPEPICPKDVGCTIMEKPMDILWRPVMRSDIAWNFEKFLIDQNGVPFQRYSSSYPVKDMEKDIQLLLSKDFQRKEREEA